MSSSTPTTRPASIWNRAMHGIARALAGEPRATVTTGISASAESERFFGAGVTASGAVIDERSSMTLSTFYACVRNIADDTSKCTMTIGRRLPDGRREVLDNHPLSYLLNVAPNEEMTAKVFRETVIGHAVSWGNGYAEIQWRGNGEVGALWPLTPDCMSVRRVGKVLRYFYEGKEINAANLIHVPGMGFDGRVGYSVARQARESLGGVMATEQFGAAFFGNAARPGGALQHPGKLSEPAYNRLKDSIKERHEGASKAGKTLILEEGMTFAAMSVPPDEAQFLSTKQFNVKEVCRWFRMPPHKVADLEAAKFNNIEHQSIEYVTDCLLGWMIRFEQEIKRKCLVGTDLYARHNVNSLLRGDQKSRMESYAIGRQWGMRSVNEIKTLEDEDPIGPAGDVYLVPVNMMNAEKLLSGNEPDPAAPAPAPEDPAPDPKTDSSAAPDPNAARARVVSAMLPVWTEEFEAFLRVESDKAKRWSEPADAPKLAAFITTHREHVRGRIDRHLTACIGAIAAAAAMPPIDAKVAAARCATAFAEEYSTRLESVPAAQWAFSAGGLAKRLGESLIRELDTITQET